jgi:hypothetical protein
MSRFINATEQRSCTRVQPGSASSSSMPIPISSRSSRFKWSVGSNVPRSSMSDGSGEPHGKYSCPARAVYGAISPTRRITSADDSIEIARCFLHLTNLPNFALDRLSRYDPFQEFGSVLIRKWGITCRISYSTNARHNLVAAGECYRFRNEA